MRDDTIRIQRGILRPERSNVDTEEPRVSRRTVTRAAAWSIPVIAVATAAPMAAATQDSQDSTIVQVQNRVVWSNYRPYGDITGAPWPPVPGWISGSFSVSGVTTRIVHPPVTVTYRINQAEWGGSSERFFDPDTGQAYVEGKTFTLADGVTWTVLAGNDPTLVTLIATLPDIVSDGTEFLLPTLHQRFSRWDPVEDGVPEGRHGLSIVVQSSVLNAGAPAISTRPYDDRWLVIGGHGGSDWSNLTPEVGEAFITQLGLGYAAGNLPSIRETGTFVYEWWRNSPDVGVARFSVDEERTVEVREGDVFISSFGNRWRVEKITDRAIRFTSPSVLAPSGFYGLPNAPTIWIWCEPPLYAGGPKMYGTSQMYFLNQRPLSYVLGSPFDGDPVPIW